nr:MAG TPA: hypothetical protein [Caudoviricetes sp.]
MYVFITHKFTLIITYNQQYLKFFFYKTVNETSKISVL